MKARDLFEQSLWPIYFRWAIAVNADEWHKLMRYLKVAGDPPYPQADGCCTFFERGNGHLCVVSFAGGEHSTIEWAGLCAHEATHLMQEIQDRMNEKKAGSEWQAYTVQAAMQIMLDRLITRAPERVLDRPKRRK